MIESTSNNELLNWAQRNSVSITLRQLELRLRHATEILANQEQGVLYQYTGIVSPETLEQMQQEISMTLKEITELADRLELGKKTESNRTILLGELGGLWIDLQDMRVDKLKRYGDVSPELSQILTPVLNSLIRHVETMRYIVNEDKDSLQAE